MKSHKRKGHLRIALKILLCCVFAVTAVSYILLLKGVMKLRDF